MKVMPIRYVRDMTRCQRFYEALGLAVDARQRNGHWTELGSAGGGLALHLVEAADAEPEVGLSFVAEEPLETLQAALAAAGFDCDVVDEAFGRSLRVTDPEGVPVQVNEFDRELYT